MEYTIEKDIPIPRKRTIDSEWARFADSMEAGDSILVPDRQKAPTRVEAGGVRVWKMLKEATYK